MEFGVEIGEYRGAKFSRTGCEQLLNQLFGFGAEKHDDLVDALVYLILGVVGEGIEERKVHYASGLSSALCSFSVANSSNKSSNFANLDAIKPTLHRTSDNSLIAFAAPSG